MTSFSPQRIPSHDGLREQASDWLARRDAGFAPGEVTQFEAWLAAAAEHRAAVAELSEAWDEINRPREMGRANHVLRELAARQQLRRRRRTTRVIAVSALAAAAMWVIALRPFAPRSTAMLPVSVTLRPMQQTLTDGSSVELNAGAELAVEFSPARRGVKLLSGEAHFTVAKDPARPFVVSVGSVEVSAIGTEFLVRRAHDEIKVLVTEGKVGVVRTVSNAARSSIATAATARAASPEIVLAAGRQVVISTAIRDAAPNRTEQVAQNAIDAALAWRSKHVEFSGTPLSEAIALFNRQNKIQLTLGNPAHGRLRVSGMFWLDDPEGFARLLEASFSIKAQRASALVISLQ
jgi:transmembrane sensor